MRRAFLSRMNQIIQDEPDTVFMTVDIGMWAMRETLSDYPERAMNFGILEDGMFSIAAGMSAQGLVPTIFGIQPYLIERTLEQIKMEFAYQRLGVNVVGTGAAVDYSKYGYSHYCAEDVGVVKMIPGTEFIAPGSAKQFIQLFDQAYRNGHPSFFRISDHPNVKHDPDVEFGKAVVMQEGDRATVVAVSVLLDEVMEACAGKNVTVLYYTTLEPFDWETLRKYCKNGKVLICEPHFQGSLDTDVLTALGDQSTTIRHVGFPREIFRNYGSYEDKILYYELNSETIQKALEHFV